MAKKQTNKKIFFLGILIVFLTIILTTLIFIFQSKISKETSQNISVYYINNSLNKLEFENKQIKDNQDKNIVIQSVLDEFFITPKNTILTRLLDDKIKINSFEYVDNNGQGLLTLDFSSDYLHMKESQELLTRAGIVYTLTSLNFVDNLIFKINGKNLKKGDGLEIGILNRETVVLNPIISPDNFKTEDIVLYFSDSQAMNLVKETRSIDITQSENIEVKIVEELISGPTNKELFSVIPQETKVRNIKTEAGICYVDLSNEFISKQNAGSSGETLTIYSIVNSLTELKGVKKVQFLIEGEKISDYRGHFDFSKPFDRNEEIII